MQLTDQEIREIIIAEKRRKNKRKKKIRKYTTLLVLVLIAVLAVGIFINKDARIRSRGIIFIDAGHGGIDGGSKVGSRLEKNDTLKISLAIKDDLQKMGFKVYMSRTDDTDVDREERGRMANKAKANFMVSIHRNRAEEGDGVEIYIPSSNNAKSKILASKIMKELTAKGFSRREIRAGTLVSKDEDYDENRIPTMPSCLVEVGFMQNKHDNELFDQGMEDNALAIATGIESAFIKIYETN